MYFDIHTHATSSSNQVFAIQNRYPTSDDFSSPFSVGMHPWFLKKETLEMDLLLMEQKLQNPNCFAIGECGLDKAIEINFQFQKEVFIKQIAFSEQFQKPIIIHCVRAFQEIIELKNQLLPTQPWIFHGFHKDKQLAISLIKNGFFLSFGEAVLNNNKTQTVILEIPIDKLLIETDNSAFTIQEIYQKIAAIKQVPMVTLQKQIQTNFTHIFKA